jgi:DNA-binding XRE family transcriptional regulator
MIAVIKNPRIEIKGDIPADFLAITRKFFGNVEVKTDDELENIADTAWYKRHAAKRTPGLNMRNFRELHGYTQNELAEKLGILRNHVSAMENEKRAISKAMALKLADIFETSPERFI